jgi:O-methyltransferase
MRLSTFKVTASKKIGMIKQIVPPLLWKTAYRLAVVKDIPDARCYDPHYSPWLEPKFQQRAQSVEGFTGLVPQSLYTLVHHLRDCLRLDGDVIECGVWRGGSAKLLREEILASGKSKKLHLFDSFAGMSRVDAGLDRHEVGDFADTSLEGVQKLVTGSTGVDSAGIAEFHQGWIPETFAGLDNLKVCFAHIDLDLYQPILDTLAFVWPRMPSRAVVVFDDYGFASCPGARRAADEFFADKPESIFSLSTGQAVVVKH